MIASSYGLNAEPLAEPDSVPNKPDTGIPLYFDYLKSVKAFLSQCLVEQSLVRVGSINPQYATNYLDKNTLVVSLANNGLDWESYSFSSPGAEIKQVEEWKLPESSPDTLVS